MKRILAILLALALLLPCVSLAETPVTIALEGMTLTLVLPPEWTCCTTAADTDDPALGLPADTVNNLLCTQGLVFCAATSGSAPELLTLCAVPAAPGMNAGDRLRDRIDPDADLVVTEQYFNGYAEYTVVSFASGLRIDADGRVTRPRCTTVYAILVNGCEYTLEFCYPGSADGTPPTGSWAQIMDSLRFHPTSVVPIPDLGISLNIPVRWAYGALGTGSGSSAARTLGMSDPEFSQFLLASGFSFLALDARSGLTCFAMPAPALQPGDREDLLAHLSTIGISLGQVIEISRNDRSFLCLEVSSEDSGGILIIGECAGRSLLIALSPQPGQTADLQLAEMLVNGIQVLE